MPEKGRKIKAKKKPSQKGKKGEASAVYMKNEEDMHLVCLNSIRVLILDDDGSWFAQGLEVDYCAQGDTVEDVKQRFQEGLCETIAEHLMTYGDIGRLLKIAPQEEWDLLREKRDHITFSMATMFMPQKLTEKFEDFDFLSSFPNNLVFLAAQEEKKKQARETW